MSGTDACDTAKMAGHGEPIGRRALKEASTSERLLLCSEILRGKCKAAKL